MYVRLKDFLGVVFFFLIKNGWKRKTHRILYFTHLNLQLEDDWSVTVNKEKEGE